MTTTVTVKANHGWPVRVTQKYLENGGDETGNTVVSVVKANSEQDFYVHSGMDLHIHEIQPSEPDFTPVK